MRETELTVALKSCSGERAKGSTSSARAKELKAIPAIASIQVFDLIVSLAPGFEEYCSHSLKFWEGLIPPSAHFCAVLRGNPKKPLQQHTNKEYGIFIRIMSQKVQRLRAYNTEIDRKVSLSIKNSTDYEDDFEKLIEQKLHRISMHKIVPHPKSKAKAPKVCL